MRSGSSEGEMRSAIFIFLILICLGTVQAQNITFSDLNIQKGIKILVYTSTGQLIGEYNSTDTIQLNTSKDYIFVLKPSEQSWFSDPFQAIELFKASVPTILSYALFFLVILATVYLAVKVIVR